MPTGRLEAFSDGVFAIAITLIVLELGVSSDAGDHLLNAILHEWPSYLAYLTSFMTIGVVWLQHSAITGELRTADATLYRLNLLVLLIVAFLPYPTKLASEFGRSEEAERVAVVFYGLTLVALALALTAFVRYAAEHRRLVKDEVSDDAVQGALAHQPSFLLYAIGIGIGFCGRRLPWCSTWSLRCTWESPAAPCTDFSGAAADQAAVVPSGVWDLSKMTSRLRPS
jgi:uncharacterized membrane protein